MPDAPDIRLIHDANANEGKTFRMALPLSDVVRLTGMKKRS
jgi:hypothetical protein